MGLPASLGVSDHSRHRVADDGLGLMLGLDVGDQMHTEGVDVVPLGVSLANRQVVGVEINADGAAPLIRHHRNIHYLGGHEHPPAFLVPLEPVTDGLPQTGGTRRLLPMLAPIADVLRVAVQRSQNLLVAVGEPHAFDGHVLPMLRCEAVRNPEPERQRPVIGHAKLATRRFISAAQHDELIATGVLLVPEPLLMAAVAVLSQVALPPPEPFGPEAQPDPPRFNVCFQCD